MTADFSKYLAYLVCIVIVIGHQFAKFENSRNIINPLGMYSKIQ